MLTGRLATEIMQRVCYAIAAIIVMGLLIGWRALRYTEISKTSQSLVEGWVGWEVRDLGLDRIRISPTGGNAEVTAEREGETLLSWGSAPTQLPGGGGV